MASYINRGESVFFQFRNGKSVLNSQCKPRMFKTAEKATLGLNYVDTDEVVEYVEQRHGRWEYEEECAKWGFPFICTAKGCGKAHNHKEKYCPNCGAKMEV